MRKMCVAALMLVAATGGSAAMELPALTPGLAEMRRFAEAQGEALWPGYGAAPFGMLLVEPTRETLICHPSLPEGFSPASRDPVTGCATATRPRSSLPEKLLAALPLFGPPSTIVMGTPAATGRTPAEWRLTLLHEHVHQWQATLPGYYERVEALDLAGGDRTGMWMLNFAFPYDDARVGAAYREASLALAHALDARGTPGFAAAAGRYLAARGRFATASGERPWRYLEFQLWQEGVARWTEIELGKHHPDPAVVAAATALEARTVAALARPDLAAQRRELAYPFGAGEAMLLAACGDGWQQRYVAELSLGALFAATGGICIISPGPARAGSAPARPSPAAPGAGSPHRGSTSST